MGAYQSSRVEVAVKRWQDFTGKAALLESNNRSFDEVTALVHPDLKMQAIATDEER